MGVKARAAAWEAAAAGKGSEGKGGGGGGVMDKCCLSVLCYFPGSAAVFSKVGKAFNGFPHPALHCLCYIDYCILHPSS